MSQLGENMRAILARDPEGRAIEFKGRWRTWGELTATAHGLDDAFARFGLGEGAVAACVLRNRPECAAALIGIVSADRCLLTLNALLPDDKLAADVEAARPPLIVALAEDWARPAFPAAARAVGAAGLCLTGDPAAPLAPVPGLEAPGAGPHAEARPGVAILMLTSGTTAAPKRAPLKMAVLEQQLIEAAGGVARHGEAGPAPMLGAAGGASIVGGALVHISGVWALLGAVAAGRPAALLEKFAVPEWRAAVVEHRPASYGGPPTALRMILDADIPAEDLASLKTLGSGTAALDPAIADEFMRRYGIPVLSNYGATEFCGGVASWSARAFQQHWQAKRGAVGRIHNSMEARIVDAETGEALPFGQEGMLELKGFATGHDDAWVRTTDRGRLDADRFLWITGRADNAIVRGGFKVHPDEVVAALQSHPAVAEASVVGLPDRRLGHAPVAALVLKPGAEPPATAELEAAVRSRLAPYCVPVAFKFVAELPRTPSMKVSMPAVRELFEQDQA